ncbi:EF-hand domain-containing protein 1 [Melanotaenia boesemani]|uniref:EF-hand domain-containing protein 1 n=1 Tax=Melanotaenia boesemani TaxID=1250792 RepID=UPI001C05D85E|nr:EF-hand domain-containing protein 1 [Melanotaenia boesemani]
MSFKWNNGLPFLPGYTFHDVGKSAFHRPQTLICKNGCTLAQRPSVGIGQDPLLSEQLRQQEISELSLEELKMTYGPSEHTVYKEFVPAHVALDKKVLRFYAYFMENILFSPEEENRVRFVVIYYYLEDDSMSIVELLVENSGIIQGNRLKRHRLPKNKCGDHYRWRDLNLGLDMEVYGFKYHITHCDAFTKEFMESNGIVLNDPEPVPEDFYTKSHKNPAPCYSPPSSFDQKHRFLTMDGKVLRFYAFWDNSDPQFKNALKVVILYYLVDDTVEIREVHEPNSGRDPFPIMMGRLRIPKKLKSETFPSCLMEMSKEDVDEYFSLKDFQLGQTIKLMGHCFLLNDCDDFTKKYYQENYPDMNLELPKKVVEVIQEKKEIPPYNGFGSLEDSLQNCLSLIPKRPRKNVLKMFENDNKVLRYLARLDSPHPEDECRLFVLYYFLSNDMISISEKTHGKHSASIGRKFLEKIRVPKPGSSVENPEFYSPADFAIGATVEVFSHRFVLIDADHYVLKYLESISSQIPTHTLESLRQKLGVEVTENLPGQQNGEEKE